MAVIADVCSSERIVHVDTDSQLITRARSDAVAFVQLYRGHYEAVFRYCVHRLFERHAAEDVTSQVFLKVVESFHRFEGNSQQFRSWLYRIANNAVNEHLRKTVRHCNLLKAACEQVDNEVADCRESSEKLAVLKQAMLSLKPKYQTVITLRFFENLKLTEIAKIVGSSPGTVRSQLSRALAKLRRKLATDLTD